MLLSPIIIEVSPSSIPLTLSHTTPKGSSPAPIPTRQTRPPVIVPVIKGRIPYSMPGDKVLNSIGGVTEPMNANNITTSTPSPSILAHDNHVQHQQSNHQIKNIPSASNYAHQSAKLPLSSGSNHDNNNVKMVCIKIAKLLKLIVVD